MGKTNQCHPGTANRGLFTAQFVQIYFSANLDMIVGKFSALLRQGADLMVVCLPTHP